MSKGTVVSGQLNQIQKANFAELDWFQITRISDVQIVMLSFSGDPKFSLQSQLWPARYLDLSNQGSCNEHKNSCNFFLVPVFFFFCLIYFLINNQIEAPSYNHLPFLNFC